MSGGKGGSPAKQETVTNNAPWSGAVPYINQGLSAASDLYNQGGPAYYPGQTFAGSNSGLDQAMASLNGINASYGNATAGDNPAYSFFSGLSKGDKSLPGLSTLQDYASGKYLTADNPYFAQMADTVRANVLPGINGAFSQAGRGVSGLAGRAQGQGLGDAIGSLAYQNYQQGLTQQQAAANSLAQYGIAGGTGVNNIYEQTLKDRLAGANAGLLAGGTQQSLDQGALDSEKARYDYNAALPYENLKNFISNISAQTAGTGSKTSNTTTTQPQPSFFSQLLGGAAGIGSLATGGLFGGFGGKGGGQSSGPEFGYT